MELNKAKRIERYAQEQHDMDVAAAKTHARAMDNATGVSEERAKAAKEAADELTSMMEEPGDGGEEDIEELDDPEQPYTLDPEIFGDTRNFRLRSPGFPLDSGYYKKVGEKTYINAHGEAWVPFRASGLRDLDIEGLVNMETGDKFFRQGDELTSGRAWYGLLGGQAFFQDAATQSLLKLPKEQDPGFAQGLDFDPKAPPPEVKLELDDLISDAKDRHLETVGERGAEVARLLRGQKRDTDAG